MPNMTNAHRSACDGTPPAIRRADAAVATRDPAHRVFPSPSRAARAAVTADGYRWAEAELARPWESDAARAGRRRPCRGAARWRPPTDPGSDAVAAARPARPDLGGNLRPDR